MAKAPQAQTAVHRSSPEVATESASAELAKLASERLEAELCQLAAHMAAAMARWLDLVAEYDRRRVWQQWECRSMAHWLVGHVGVSLITARQHVQVAERLQRFPLLRAAFAKGTLSYSRVRAVSRCMTAETEAELVEMAHYATAPQLERFAAGMERAQRAADPAGHDHHHGSRSLHLVVDDDGSWILRCRLPAESGAALQRAINAEARRLDDAERTDDSTESSGAPRIPVERRIPVEQRRVDALVQLVTRGHHAPSGADGTTDGTRPLIVVHRHADGDELEDGPAITARTADRLACDADVVVATHWGRRRHVSDPDDCHADRNDRDDDLRDTPDDGRRITYTRARRTPSATQRRAVMERDRACRFTGCNRRGQLHAHHIVHYADHGPTSHDNLIMLCAAHHHAVHHDNWSIHGHPDGRLTFTKPGRTSPNPAHGDIEAIIERLHGPIGPRLYGDPFELGYAVSVFLDLETTKKRQAAKAAAEHDAAESGPTATATR